MADSPPIAFIKAACVVLHVRYKAVIGPRKHAPLVSARRLIAFVLREKQGLSYPVIRDLLGYREHTVVMVGIAKVRALLEQRDDWVMEKVTALRALATQGLSENSTVTT